MNPQGIIILAIAAVVGHFTKPSDEQFAKYVHQRMKIEISSNKLSKDDNLLSGLMKVGCALDLESCANVMLSNMTASYNDYIVMRTVSLGMKDGSKLGTCWGGFKFWWCRGWGISD